MTTRVASERSCPRNAAPPVRCSRALLRDVLAEVLLAEVGEHALLAEFGERLVDGLHERGLVLREGEGALARVGLGGDGELRVGRLLEVVEVGELVVDGRVDAALFEERDGLRPALDGLDVRAASTASW